MTLSNIKKFLAACQEAGIKNYQFDTDLGTHLYNNTETSIIVLDETEEVAYNFRNKINDLNTSYNGNLYVQGANLSDIHEVRFGGTIDEIKAFATAYGLTFTDEQLNLLLKNDLTNYNVKPETGDYNFVPLTNSALEALSEEERKEYELNLKEYQDKKNGLSDRIVAKVVTR